MSEEGKGGRGGSPERILGNFRLQRTLGSGGTGKVYLATLIEDEAYARAGARVALKVLHPDRMDSTTVVSRFLREAELGRTLDHPAVVRTYDVGKVEDGDSLYHYLVMEYVEGRTLRDLIQQLRTLPEALLRDLAIQIASALEAVHRAHAAHRDLKPGNILITPEYQVKLMDLGVALLTEGSARLTRTGYFVGTILYAAPEQVRGEQVGPAADLYSLGVVLYEAATGVQPFDASTAQAIIQRQLRHVPPKAGHLNPDLTPWMEEVIACLMAKEIKERFADARTLVEVLKAGEESSWWRRRQQVVGEGETRSDQRRIAVTREAGFVGRFAELQTLRSLFQDTRSGSGRVLLIEGEAGVGKSRLLDEMLRHLEAEKEEFHLLYGSNSPGRLGGSGGAMTRAVVDFFGRSELEENLAAYLIATPRLVPGFVALLTGAPPTPGSEPLSGDAIQALFVYLASVLAAEQPVVWLVEDLHFATADGRALLYALAREVQDQPILLVATTRPGLPSEELAEFERLPHSRRMTLGRLSTQQIKRLLRGLLHSADVAEDLWQRMALKSDGNPFFIVEMVRELKERKVLRPAGSGDAFTLTGEVTPALVPASVRELLLSRLNPLTAEERAVVDLAAVQGYDFDPDLIARIRGVKRLQVLESLAEMERRTGAIRSTGSGFRFDHHQLQEVIYETLPPALRVEYHGALAQAFEERQGLAVVPPTEMQGEDAVFLAVHSLRGHQSQSGKRTLLRALEYLGSRYQNQALLELMDLALEALGDEDPALCCKIHRRQVDCFELLGQRREQEQAVAAAARAAARAGDEDLARWVELDRCRFLLASQQYQETQTALEALLERAEGAGDGRLKGDALGVLGTFFLHLGEPMRSHEAFQRQLGLAESFQDRRFRAKASCNLGFALLSLGEFRRANECFDDSLEVFREIDFLQGQARVILFLGLTCRYVGDYVGSRKHLETALAQAREIGFRDFELVTLGNLGELATDEGDLDAAQHHLESFLTRSRTLRLRNHEGWALLFLGDVARARGDVRKAESLYNEALGLQQSLGVSRAIAYSTCALGRLFLEQGRKEEAVPLLVESREVVEEYFLEVPGQLPLAYLALAGEVPVAEVELTDRNPVYILAEAHLALYQASGDRQHLEAARKQLQTMSRHLDRRQGERFWTHNPAARTFRRLLRRELEEEGGEAERAGEEKLEAENEMELTQTLTTTVGIPRKTEP